jgi:hypothetical protein
MTLRWQKDNWHLAQYMHILLEAIGRSEDWRDCTGKSMVCVAAGTDPTFSISPSLLIRLLERSRRNPRRGQRILLKTLPSGHGSAETNLRQFDHSRGDLAELCALLSGPADSRLSQDGPPSKFCSTLEVFGSWGLSIWTEI